MVDGKTVLGLIVAGVAFAVAVYALRRAEREREPEVEPSPPESHRGLEGLAQRAAADPLERMEWWPRVWGVEHGAVHDVREDDGVFDWSRNGAIAKPRAYVGAGRGHEL